MLVRWPAMYFPLPLAKELVCTYGNNTHTTIDNIQQQIDKYMVQLSFFIPAKINCNFIC